MTIDTFLDFSETAASNIDVAGIGIQGTNAVQNFDNAFRQLMAILRRDLDNGMVFTSKSAGYTALANDNNAFIRFSAAATLSLTAAATLGADWHVWVMADGGAVVIDPNSTETINGATTITIPDGATVLVICDGANFRATEDYTRFVQATVDVASATTTDIGAAASWNVRITGTTTITGLGTVAEGTLRFVRMEGTLTLTHNGTSLILPNGGNNITTAANDCFLAKSLGSGNWIVMFYEKATPSIIMGSSTQTATGVETALSFPIPTGVEKIEVSIVSFSTNGTNVPMIRLSTGGSYASTSYLGSASNVTLSAVSTGNHSTGFLVANSVTAATTGHGGFTLTKVSGDTWEIHGGIGMSDTTFTTVIRGSRVMGGTVDGIQITTASANTIDSGSIVRVIWYR